MSYVDDLFGCCRSGNLEYLRILVEEKEIELNTCDKWDGTPLYYACLCGHEKTVEYLLQNGAKCEANTFDGERCLYAALTQKIKEMLKSYKAITKDCIRRDRYVEFFKQCLISETCKDFQFIVHGAVISVHRLILASRSTYFAQMFQTRWRNKLFVHLKHPFITVSAFQYMLQYLYTARIDIPVREVDDLKRLCKQCNLVELNQKLDTAVKNYLLYTNSKPKHVREKVSVLSIQPSYEKCNLNEAYFKLVECAIPYEVKENVLLKQALPDIFCIDLQEDSFENEDILQNAISEDPLSFFVDVCFVVKSHQFYAHKVFFAGRSDYFKSLLHFHEMSATSSLYSDSAGDDSILYVSLNDVSIEAFIVVLLFIYTNQADISDDVLDEVLHLSAMYLLPDLKRICATKLSNLQTTDNVVDVLKLARFYNLTYLEASCCEFIAMNLFDIIDREEFINLVLSDAREINNREETDTITIIDDIRFHLHKWELPGFNGDVVCEDLSGENNKFKLIDDFLLKLNLEC